MVRISDEALDSLQGVDLSEPAEVAIRLGQNPQKSGPRDVEFLTS